MGSDRVVEGIDGFYRGEPSGRTDPKDLVTLIEHNEYRRQLYYAEFDSEPRRNAIECPVCGNELYDPTPNTIMATLPPQKHIACSVCEYKGFRIA